MKNKLPKILCITIIITLVLCFSACSEKSNNEDVNTTSAEVNTTEKIDTPEANEDNPKEPETPETENETNNPDTQPETENSDNTDSASAESKVAAYVANNGTNLETDFETQFYNKTGMTCDCKITANGTRVVVNCNITGFNDLSEDEITKIKILAASMKSTAKSVLTDISNVEPEITGVDFNICEEDGDVITTVSVNK